MLVSTFYGPSVSFNSLSKLKISKNLWYSCLLSFLNAESLIDSTDFSASVHNRKTAARRFDTINDILRSRSLAKSLLKGRNAPICRSGRWAVNKALQWKTNRKTNPIFPAAFPHFREFRKAFASWSSQLWGGNRQSVCTCHCSKSSFPTYLRTSSFYRGLHIPSLRYNTILNNPSVFNIVIKP